MRVFLAGATGVIGTPLVPQLLEAGHEVTAMTRSVERAAQLDAIGAHPVVCDVFDAGRVRAAMAGAAPEAVIHQLTSLPARLDWADPGTFAANNRVRTEGTRVLVAAARAAGACRVVAQSIAFAYAPTGDRVKDEDAPLFTGAPPPLDGTVAAVVEHERLVTRTAGIDGLVLRYGMLYGPGTYHDRHGSTAADILAGRVPLVEGATGMYSWLHVDDAAAAAVAAVERGAPGIYNVVDDEPAPQPEWLPVLARALGAAPPRAAQVRPSPDAPEMSLRGASNAKAKRELAWRPRYASWREGFAANLA
ncbi:MAG TPA: NAD(P)-dependent oxidoreductase [Solirubrobacteraceae bacterium]|nr:NAD(P)-dependent oxidoreductase [Solirubrobacteraceae bacterium]